MISNLRWRILGVILAAIAVTLGSAQAGPGQDKKRGGSNPTGIAVVDDDLIAAVAPSTETDPSYATKESESGIEMVASSPAWDVIYTQPVAYQIQAHAAHEVATGRDVVVAVLDGGFNVNHPVLAGRVLPGWDAMDGDSDVNDPGNGFDDDGDGIVDATAGHGTFVASTVLMAAPGATILPVRVRDDEGFGPNKALVDGLKFAIEAGADVINLSLTEGQAAKQGIWSVIYKAQGQGIVIVVAAGNRFTGQLSNLAVSSDILAVGAVDADDRIAEFSNYDTLDSFSTMIFAPGVDLVGALGSEELGNWNGTSFSAGIVSGAAALLKEMHPEYALSRACRVIGESVDPVWNLSGELHNDGGRINLAKVVGR